MRRKIGLAVLSALLSLGSAALSEGQKPGSGKSSAKPAPPASAPTPERLIAKNSVGPVKLRMTVAEVRKVLPQMSLARTTDGEGMALIEVKEGDRLVMVIYAGEESAESPIDEQAKVEHITVYDKRYATAEGVHPQMPLSAVEKKYGKLSKLYMSDIESREYAEFPELPDGFTLQVGAPKSGIAGDYPKFRSETTRYVPGAFILNISVYYWRG